MQARNMILLFHWCQVKVKKHKRTHTCTIKSTIFSVTDVSIVPCLDIVHVSLIETDFITS